MATTKKKILNYPHEQMEQALDQVKKGMSVAAAAKKYGVPRITLLYKANGKTPISRKMGPDSVLTKDEENIIVQWIFSLARSGFPVSKDNVIDSVQKIIMELGRENPFKNNRPGRTWLKSFMKRNPSISNRVAQNLTISRASVTSEQLKTWANSIFDYLIQNGYSDILDDPSRVFNGDESAFFLNPKGSKVLAPKGDKTVYQQINSDEKECLTVLVTANADGTFAPPLIVFKYERIPVDIAQSVPSSWGIGKSESGWMNSALFYEFIANVFHPWLLENKIKLPIILFIDGHSSHMALHTSQFCNKNGIILVALHPNSTHLIQPMDVAVFRSLKSKWKDEVHHWRLQNLDNPILKKRDFSPIFDKALKQISPSIIKNGFRTCGIVPWNPDAVKLTLQKEKITHSCITTEKTNYTSENKVALKVLENVVGQEKLELFKSSETWKGSNEDASLFIVWQKIRNSTYPLFEGDSLDSSKRVVDPLVSEAAQGSSNSVLNTRSAISTGESSESILNPIVPLETPKTQPFLVPSPFKRVLYYPDQTLTKKNGRTKKEMLPGVITSQSWRNYHESKAKKKVELEENKIKKAEERQKKKDEKEEIKKKKQKLKKKQTKKQSLKRKHISSSEDEIEWQPSGNSSDDASFELGSVVSDFEDMFAAQNQICDVQRLLFDSDEELQTSLTL